MLTNVFTKTTRDRWLGWLVGAAAVALMFLFGMAVYQDIDLSLYTDLPVAFRTMFGIPENADVGSLAYGAIYGSYGMLTMAALALATGAASIGTEERNGTIGLLLGNPVSRTSVLISKAASLVILTAFGFVILWVAAIATPAILDVSTIGLDINALLFAMFINALFYGFFALAISAWTGNSSLASGVSAGVMVVSFIAVGLLPIVSGWENLAKVFPWYYYQNSQPVMNGLNWVHMGVLVAGSAVFAVIAVVGINRRDLRGQSVGVKMIDRLRANHYTHAIAERFAGTARVSRIWIKTASDYQGFLLIVSFSMFLMAIIVGPMYGLIDAQLKDFGAAIPDAMLAMFGGGDLSTFEGFYQIEIFGLMAPLAVMAITIAIGAGAMAGEEKRNTMGLLLANPIRRSTIILQKTITMVIYASIVGFATFLGTAAGATIGNLGMSLWYVAATCILATLLGLAFGGLALALGAATGRVPVAVFGSVGVAFVTYIVNAFLPLSQNFGGWAKMSPFYYYLGGDPLLEGLNWIHAGVLSGLAVALFALSIVLFERRDLRAKG